MQPRLFVTTILIAVLVIASYFTSTSTTITSAHVMSEQAMIDHAVLPGDHLSEHTTPNYARPNTTVTATIPITISDFAFNPNMVIININDTVVWTNLDFVNHTTSSTILSGTTELVGTIWDSPFLSQNQSFSFTFTSPGLYTYRCKPHGSMRGSVLVLAPQAKLPLILRTFAAGW